MLEIEDWTLEKNVHCTTTLDGDSEILVVLFQISELANFNCLATMIGRSLYHRAIATDRDSTTSSYHDYLHSQRDPFYLQRSFSLSRRCSIDF